MNTVREIFETMVYGPAPEAADVAVSWLDRHGRTFHPFINGEFIQLAEPAYFDSISPRDENPWPA